MCASAAMAAAMCPMVAPPNSMLLLPKSTGFVRTAGGGRHRFCPLPPVSEPPCTSTGKIAAGTGALHGAQLLFSATPADYLMVERMDPAEWRPRLAVQ